MSTAKITTLDIRPVPPPLKHPTIFHTFDSLADGEILQIVNDHDPKPLYYQMLFERQGQFEWDYLEQGPMIWKVNIKKIAR